MALTKVGGILLDLTKNRGDILPAVTAVDDMGSATLKYRDLHLSRNILVGGTVDGRDLSLDGAILDGLSGGSGTTGVALLAKFGAVGDGATDDLTAIQAALDSTEGILDGEGKTYFISDTVQLTRGNLALKNINLVGPLTGPIAAAAPRPGFLQLLGSQGTNVNLTVSAIKGDNSVTVASVATLSVNQWVRFQSDEVLFGGTNTAGETAKIKDITGLVVTFYDSLYLNYTTGDVSNIAPLTTIENVTIKDCSVAGDPATALQIGILCDFVANIVIENFRSTDCQYGHIVFFTGMDCKVLGGQGERTAADIGLNYGIVIANAANNILVDGYTGREMRHVITTGGSNGMVRYTRVINTTCLDMKDAGLDTHGSAAEVDFSFNFVHIKNGTDVDGIICQGEQFTCIGNKVYNTDRHGIFHQPLLEYVGNSAHAVIEGNTIEYIQPATTAGSVGILMSTDIAATVVKGVSITGNRIKKAPVGIQVLAKLASIESVVVNSNITEGSTSRSIYLRANVGTSLIRNVVIGNVCTNAAASDEGIFLQGVGGGSVDFNVIEGNIIDGSATFGLRLTDTDTTRIGQNNVFRNNGTDKSMTGDTNTVDADGAELKPGKTAVWIPADHMTPRAVLGSTFAPAVATTAGRPDTTTQNFIETADTFAQFSLVLGNRYDGGFVSYKAYWTHDLGADTGGVAWALQAGSFSDGDPNQNGYGGAKLAVDNAQGASDEINISGESAGITVNSVPADGDLLYFQVSRDISQGTDTLVGVAKLIGVMVFYTSDQLSDA